MKTNPPPYNKAAECSVVAPGGPSISGAGGQLRLRTQAEPPKNESHPPSKKG